ncbi:MAG: S8 family serine peptidase [Verrucomicrobiales bacterium]
MKNDRSLIAWLATPLVVALLLLGVLMWIGYRRWQLEFRERSGTVAKIVLPELQGAGPGEAASPPDLTDPGPSDADVNALLDALLRQRVQSIGAIENEAVLRFKSREAYEAFLRRGAATGLRVLSTLDGFLAARVGFDSIDALRRELTANIEDIEDVGANYLFKIPGVPEVEDRTNAGGAPFGNTLFEALGADGNRASWGQGVTVAVLDTGLTNHPAYARGQIVAHIDLIKDGLPLNGHGDAMGTLIGGSAPGAEGVAPAARLLDIRIFDTSGEGDSFVLAQGIREAVDRGAQVINISGAGYGDSGLVRQAIEYAQQRNVTIVAAVGNEQAGVKAFPAAYEGVISVSGVDSTGRLAYFSNSGGPTLAAPAVSIPSGYSTDGEPAYVFGHGTSQAAALVSGAAAKLLSQGQNPVSALPAATKPPDPTATPHEVGAGILYLGPR